MDNVSIILARVIVFVEMIDLDPRGKLHYPDFVGALVERYNFKKSPQKPEEIDLQKGPIVLADGKWENGSISKIEIYGGGFAVDTRSSTEDSEKLLDECLNWASEKFGIQYYRNMLKRKGFVSQLIFHSDAPIFSSLSSSLSKLGENVTQAIEKSYGEKIDYQPSSFSIHFDQTTRQLSPAPFTLMRRLGIPFSENKYFSEAPLPTNIHEELLHAFEADFQS